MIKKLACTLAFALPLAMAQSTANSPSEIEQLKQMLLDQQKQINELKIRLGMAVNRARHCIRTGVDLQQLGSSGGNFERLRESDQSESAAG